MKPLNPLTKQEEKRSNKALNPLLMRLAPVQTVCRWWRLYLADAPQPRQPSCRIPVNSTPPPKTQLLPGYLFSGQMLTQFTVPRKLTLVVAIASLTSIMGYRFYNSPRLNIDTVAPETLTAPIHARIFDERATEEKRTQVRTGAIPVLTIDPNINQEIDHELKRLLAQGDAWRQIIGQFPFTDTEILSSEVQHYLRQTPEWRWREVQYALEAPTSNRDVAPAALPGSFPALAIQQTAIAQLTQYQKQATPDQFSQLMAQISKARYNYSLALERKDEILPISEAMIVYDMALLDLPEEAWLETQQAIWQAKHRMTTQGIPQGLPKSLLRVAAQEHLKNGISPKTQVLAIEVLVAALKPNLIKDAEATRKQAEQVASAVEPLYRDVRRGEVIVRAGEKITASSFLVLDYFGMSQRRMNLRGLVGFGLLVTGGILVLSWVERRTHPGMRHRDDLLVLLLAISVPVLGRMGVPSASLPAIGLLLSSFYGSPLGLTVVGLLTAILPVGMEIVWSDWLASGAGGLLGALLAGRMRSREEIALLGIAVGITQGLVSTLVTLIGSAAAGLVWYTILVGALIRAAGGITWSIVALGLSPYLEHLFDLVTPIRLAELSNPNRPLLKRLATEAPGTFQHTLFVSTLAEAAAKALDCNVELVRAGTLYHDIGKMHDPLGFIENQMGGPNKHETEIQDPWQSAEIIKKHVSEGLVMARKYRLPKAIQAFIPEHQGTMTIAYFYHQAQQIARDNPQLLVREQDFRYDGPIPQSRETGILMLADSCEAALRSLKDATYEEALAMVNKILKNRWQDQQLVNSGITRAEMTILADVFVQVWQQFHHKRIAYPKAPVTVD